MQSVGSLLWHDIPLGCRGTAYETGARVPSAKRPPVPSFVAYAIKVVFIYAPRIFSPLSKIRSAWPK